MTDNTEYLRRNLVVAKAVGVREGLKYISNRLHDNKNSPLWLLAIVKNELAKTSDICIELARHRYEVKNKKSIIDRPTRGQITDACLSYRHDYGLMDRVEREILRADAVRWLEIWDDVSGGE